MTQGKVALVQLDKTGVDGQHIGVLMVEVVTDKQKITISDKEQAISAEIRDAAERLIELVQQQGEQKK